MRNFFAVTLLCAVACPAAFAAGQDDAPPAMDARAAAQASPVEQDRAIGPSEVVRNRASADMSRLEPTESDFRAAREARARRPESLDRTYVSNRGTRIQESFDQNHDLTEVKVTPGTTEIPYTMENRSHMPIDNSPGHDPRSTLGTPKFFKHTW